MPGRGFSKIDFSDAANSANEPFPVMFKRNFELFKKVFYVKRIAKLQSDYGS